MVRVDHCSSLALDPTLTSHVHAPSGKLMKAFWAEVEKVKADGAEVGRVAKELLMGEKK